MKRGFHSGFSLITDGMLINCVFERTRTWVNNSLAKLQPCRVLTSNVNTRVLVLFYYRTLICWVCVVLRQMIPATWRCTPYSMISWHVPPFSKKTYLLTVSLTQVGMGCYLEGVVGLLPMLEPIHKTAIGMRFCMRFGKSNSDKLFTPL